MVKKLFLTFCGLMLAITCLMGQAKKPTLMVVPSDAWCNQNGYVLQYDEMGYTKTAPDYSAALSNDMELKLIIAKINELMADRGFPLKDLEATMASLERMEAEEMAIMSKTSGAQVAESLLDRLRRVAKADIIIEISWEVTHQGPRSTLTYIMRGLDSYSNKHPYGQQEL